MGEDLASLIDEYFRDRWDEHPEEGAMLGLPEYADRLGTYSADSFDRRAAKTDEWLDRFGAVGDDGLTVDDTIDRDLIMCALRGDTVRRDWQVWKRNPDTYLGPGLMGVFDLLLHRILPERELARAVESRLDQIPAILADGTRQLDEDLAPPIFIERALGMCQAAMAYAREIVPGEFSEDGDRASVGAAGERAGDAFQEFAAFLTDLKERARGTYAIGDEMYSAILQQREMLGYGARELRERGQAEFDRLSDEMAKLANDLRGTTDFVAVMRELNANHPATPEEMRATYEEWTERARAFLAERDLVTFLDGENCKVVPSPVFQRAIMAVASYSQPPALTGDRTGHFFVPYPPDGISEAEVQQRLEFNSFAAVPTISVHEAYPGHHWHLITMNANPRIARKAEWSSYFGEGWALYVEMMMVEEGFYDDPTHVLGVYDARIFRAARVIVDTGLHLGEMSFDEGVAFMMDRVGLSEPNARAEVGRYCTWPTQAPSYLTGCLEIERMREDWLARGGTLKKFHDTLAGSGSLPIALAERAITSASV